MPDATFRSVPSALSALLLAGLACAACSGPSPEAAKASPTAEPVKSDTPEAKAPPATSSQPTRQVSAGGGKASTLPDPSWFRPDIFPPTATMTKSGRSAPDVDGRFSAQMLFNLADGATVADCAEPLAKAVSGVVPDLKREEKDGRVTLTGETPEYAVHFICGEAKGKMSAYVSYRRTQPAPLDAVAPTPAAP